MNEKDHSIVAGIAELVKHSNVTEDLWEIVLSIASLHASHGRSQGAKVSKEDATGWAADFIVTLTKRGPAATEAITNRSALSGEFGKWITHSKEPERKQLWSDISSALLALEKEGIVERPPKQRNYRNSNHTLWSLKGHLNNRTQFVSDSDAAALAPDMSKNRPGRQLLKIAESRAWVEALLRKIEGAVSMHDIVSLIASHLKLTTFIDSSSHESKGEKEGGDELSWTETTPAQQIAPDLEARIEQEIEYITESVWRDVGKITRGREVVISGHRVLCCYWIPKNIFDRKVTFEQFGPKSTVKEIEYDIKRICKEYFPKTNPIDSDSSDRLSRMRVTAAVLEGLTRHCSENGYCTLFNVNEASN